MKIKLAYGKKGLLADIPDHNIVKTFRMKDEKVLIDPYIEFTKSLLQPIGIGKNLFDMARSCKSACILVCDITRPVPNKLLLPPLLKTLHAAGLSHDDILLLIATGTHRSNTGKELEELVGAQIAKEYHIENHDIKNKEAHALIGETASGIPIWLDKRFLNAEMKIATGFIEPHMFAGYSGGRKLVVPGIAGLETLKYMHGPHILSQPGSREGNLVDNPFHNEATEMAKIAGLDFIINVSLNEKNEITGIFSGEPQQAFLQGTDFVANKVKSPVSEKVDVVVTTGGGYPLDTTWYQTIKGLSSVQSIVKDGGTIIIASECSEGFGGSDFDQLLLNNPDLDSFMEKIQKDDFFVTDQWQYQKFINVAKKVKIVLVSEKLWQIQPEIPHVTRAESVETAINNELKIRGASLKIAVIPKGPYILPVLE